MPCASLKSVVKFILAGESFSILCTVSGSLFPVPVITNCATSCAVIFILVNELIRTGSNGMFEHSKLVGNTWPWAYPALCFSCGYFAYDQWDMLHYRLYSGWIPSILVHHLLLLVCFTLALYRNVTINYLILTLICEVSLYNSLSLCNCF